MINIDGESNGIKSEPDEDDNDCLGTIIINGGNINIYSQIDSIQAAYKLEIDCGNFSSIHMSELILPPFIRIQWVLKD